MTYAYLRHYQMAVACCILHFRDARNWLNKSCRQCLQGFWPDGIYTAATEEALLYDMRVAHALGFTTLRKHIKVEPDHYYHAADKLGMLIWQDMPSMYWVGLLCHALWPNIFLPSFR